MTDLERLTDLLDDMQKSGTSYFGGEVSNQKVAEYLLKKNAFVEHTAHWVISDGALECSACDFIFPGVDKWGRNNIYMFNFCPHCGAKMENGD